VPDVAADLLRAILANLPLGVWVARAPSGEVVYANPAFQAILGMDAVEGVPIQGAPETYGIYDREGRVYPVERLPFSRVLASGGPVTVDDLVLRRGPRGDAHVRAFAAPIRNAEGAITLVVVAFIDITAEVQAVDERKRVEAQLHYAVHHAPVILWATDRNGVITLSEGSALARLGLKSGQLVGQSVPDLYQEQPELLAQFRRALAGEKVSWIVKLGEVVLESWMNPVRDAHGELAGVIGMSTDVTERRRLEARIIQNDRVSAMGTLAASVAHEINNPLTYVLGNLAAAEAELGASERAAGIAALLADARAGADRIALIARDLHTFSRPGDESVRPVALQQVIGTVLQLVRKELAARAHLTVELAETPPVRGNESRLVQVVLNLLVNAWQALPVPDPARHRITLRTRAEDGHAVIEVADTGPGVPPEHRERVFDPFFTTKEVGAGTGLGLFVCRNIVQGFGGQIEVTERPGGGALFRVRLPVMAAGGPAAAPEPTPPPAARRPRVLIVDDDDRVARVLERALEEEFLVRTVHDGSKALELLLADPPPDLTFCDLMMKGCSGMELYEAVRRQAPDRLDRLVFMTGGAFTAAAAAFVESHPDAVVYKPFDVLAEARQRLAR
jgi:PAS domain S-box-containing protein